MARIITNLLGLTVYVSLGFMGLASDNVKTENAPENMQAKL